MTYYNIKNLISNKPGSAQNIDPNLITPWGMLIPDNTIWISDNGTGFLTNYTLSGTNRNNNVSIPSINFNLSAPTSFVKNYFVGGFLMSASDISSYFIIATEQGTVCAYNSSFDPSNAIIAINRNVNGDIYTGIAAIDDKIYLADFAHGTIKVFDSMWNYVLVSTIGNITIYQFYDPNIPSEYSPFNIVYLDGLLFVLYALNGGSGVVMPGVGYGYISMFLPTGQYIKTLIRGNIKGITTAPLNAPFSIIHPPPCYNLLPDWYLVGNYGDGTINIFGSTGSYIGPLSNQYSSPLSLNGLLNMVVYSKTLYFVSAPYNSLDGLNGLVGTINLIETSCGASGGCYCKSRCGPRIPSCTSCKKSNG
jgi:uncharacterized protein (TIGR03118 family)